MKKCATRLVPCVLTLIQWQQRILFGRNLSRRVCTQHSFLDRIVNVNESWVWSYDLLSKMQSVFTMENEG